MVGISTDQKEMRSAFLGGFAGQSVSGIIWFTGIALIVFAIIGRTIVLNEEKKDMSQVGGL